MTEEQRWRIAFYTDRRGRSPVVVLLNDLTPHERAEVANVFRLLRVWDTARYAACTAYQRAS